METSARVISVNNYERISTVHAIDSIASASLLWHLSHSILDIQAPDDSLYTSTVLITALHDTCDTSNV